ncbi:Crp/Fnr family transcriptional regulator [Allopontixanthobacter sp.]|uniref:Crp/Fnr family transcriptional regulator n=1 Tax=Allopontixanthobacter sp. TaxID=2906452 RepID=UPI002AB98999|nr:Crp/Fnr family transcriptional regulator [Allopontixanthobacter sp.]MDZ4306925.1 Crp/Fnr family transcriptional regulator [Allopontixanthobacter sp.]
MSVNASSLLPYVEKIERRRPLSDEARAAFLALPVQLESYGTYQSILNEGERPDRCCLIVEGVVSRYKSLKNGRRQINSFHYAGDMVDLQAAILTVADTGIRTHTPTKAVRIDCEDILDLAEKYPEWARAFWFDTQVDASIFREWTLNVGQRTAVERVAHLLLEISARLESIGQSDGKEFVLPVTQADLADAVGLSAVHTNRSIQQLRHSGALRTHGRKVVIENYPALAKVASFDRTYLHPEGPRR